MNLKNLDAVSPTSSCRPSSFIVRAYNLQCGDRLPNRCYDEIEIKDYKSIDVLKYEHIRKQAKVYSNWPTFPQLFIDGKFVGGSDIVSEMHKDGSFKELLLKAKLIEE